MQRVLDYITKPRDNLIDYAGAFGFGYLTAQDQFWQGAVFLIVCSIVADIARWQYEKHYP